MKAAPALALFLLFARLAATAENGNDGIPLERVGAMLEAARMIERNNKGVSVDLMDLIENGGSAVNNKLDEYSRMMSKEEYRRLQSQKNGFGGLGIVIRTTDQGVLVTDLLAESPAIDADLQAGDLIIRIGGTPAAGLQASEAAGRLRGPVGSTVELSILREGRELSRRVQRRQIAAPTVYAGKKLPSGVGLIRVTGFQDGTPRQLAGQLDHLHAAGIGGLILDLRGNSGGSIDAALLVAGLFLPTGKTMVNCFRDGGTVAEPLRVPYGSGRYPGLPMIVLVDGGTASAAELLAAGLRDNGRARLLGQRTYGKGIGQQTVALPDGTALRLTTSRYTTPNGTEIDGRGLQPDIAAPAGVAVGDGDPWIQAAEQALQR